MLKNAYSQVNTLRNLLGRVHYVNSCGCIMAYPSNVFVQTKFLTISQHLNHVIREINKEYNIIRITQVRAYLLS